MHDHMESGTGFGFLLSEVTTRWRQALDRRFRPIGLSQATWRALFHLERRGDPLPQHELADSMGIEGPTLVRLLDTLQRSGLVERQESPGDRRAKLVSLTPRARTLLVEIHGMAARLRTEILDGVTPEDLAVCTSVLRRINANAMRLKGDKE